MKLSQEKYKRNNVRLYTIIPLVCEEKNEVKRRILRAGAWTIIAYGLTQITRVCTSLITTRLLVPEVFGIMVIAIVINSGLGLFSDLGILQSIVRSKRGNDRHFLDTLWVIQILRGGAIWVIALLLAAGLAAIQAAGLIAGNSVYASPVLPYVISVVSFTAVLAGFESTNVAVARRELSLARLSQLEIVCNIVAVGVTIAWALIYRSIWALVGGWVIAAALRTVLTHVMLAGTRNRFRWDRDAVLEVFGFGKWVLLSSAIGFVTLNGDRLVLSGLLSSRELGLYSIAYLILNGAQQGLSKLAANVAYPALSEVVRKQPTQLSSAYYRVRLPIDICCLILGGFLFAAGEDVVRILYDSRYAGAGAMLAVLSLALISSRYEVAEQVFLALGKPRLLAVIGAFRMAALYTLVPIGFSFAGLSGAIWGIVVAGFLPTLVTIYFASQNGIFSAQRELSRMLALPVGFIMGMGVKAVIGN